MAEVKDRDHTFVRTHKNKNRGYIEARFLSKHIVLPLSTNDHIGDIVLPHIQASVEPF